MALSSDSTVEVKFVYTRDDYLAAMNVYNSLMPRSNRESFSDTINSWIVIISVIALVFIGIVGIVRFRDWFLPTMGFGLAIWYGVRLIRNRFLIPTVDFDQEKGWHAEKRWRISNEGIEFISEITETKSKWSFFDKVLETDKSYLFIHNENYDNGWRFLPKRVFESIDDEQKFRNLVQSNSRLVSI